MQVADRSLFHFTTVHDRISGGTLTTLQELPVNAQPANHEDEGRVGQVWNSNTIGMAAAAGTSNAERTEVGGVEQSTPVPTDVNYVTST